MTFFITDKPAPVLNTPHFKKVYGKQLPFDHRGLVRALEMVAFPNRLFEVVREKEDHILEIKTVDYPSISPLYIDSRFGQLQKEKSDLQINKMPTKEVIIKRLLKKQGLLYVWGGNWSLGLSSWEKWYPPPSSLTPFEKAHWTLRGVDCSGLLYEACGGLIPRNTSELMSYGKQVSFEDVQPLDLILFEGHVIIALDKENVIESSHEMGGVCITPLEKRLQQIEKPTQLRRFLQMP